MGIQDLKRRLKSRFQEKLGSSGPKDQFDSSDFHSAESQKHQIKAGSDTLITKGNGSNAALAHSDEAPQKHEEVVPASHSFRSSQSLVNPRPDDVPIKELWNIAYKKLREEDGELMEKYEKKLRGNMIAALGSTLGSNANMRDRMQMILEHKMNEVNANVWKLKFRSSEVEVRELMQPILGIVSLVNEYITEGVSVNPYASLAWVGISLLLPLFLNPSVQMASLAKGLEFISTLIAQSRMREELYTRRYELKPPDGHSYQQSHREYKNGLERLYRQVLKFQATSYCYFANDSVSRLCSDTMKWNDWDQLIDEIRQKESLFNKLSETWRDIQYDTECSAVENRHQQTMRLWFTIGESVSGLERAVKAAQEQKDRVELLKWLCNIDHTELYNSARNKYKDGTGEWLIDGSETFKAWEASTALKSFLWLHGKAGSGKSILSSSVIKHLQSRNKGIATTVLAYFYFSFSDIQKQRVDGMLESLIKQITAHRPYTPHSVQRLGEYKNNGGRPDTETLLEALIASMQGFSAVYIIIDALDECPMLNDERKKLLGSLRHIVKGGPDSLHILCTSRKEIDIDKTIRPLLSEPLGTEIDLSIQREVLNNDVSHYIDSILLEPDYDSWPADIKEEARNALMEKADGMFQYVRCQFENLQKLSSTDAVRKALRDLPSGLDSTYDRMLLSIDADFQPQVIASLKWLAFSVEPLEVDQLAEIFVLPSTIESGFERMSYLFSPMDVLKYFPGLMVTQISHNHWDRKLYVRLAHFSIKEYLISDRISQGSASAFAFTEADAHMHIGCLCLAYHSYISSMTDLSDVNEHRAGHKLVKYVTRNWAKHLEMIPHASWPPGVSRDAALSFSMRSQSSFIMLYEYSELTKLFHKPHCYTARSGFRQLTEMLISSGAGKYLTKVDLGEGLSYATVNRRMSIARLFLDKGAEIHDCLQWPARKGDIAVVRLLLDHEAKTNALAGELDLALRAAVWEGQLDILKLLRSRGADINSPFIKEDYRPFSRSGRLIDSEPRIADCLRFIFDNGAGVNMKENCSLAAALSVAARHEMEEVSRLLLDRGANVNEPAGQDGHPLQTLITNVSRPSLRFLEYMLNRGADPNAQGGTYNTALQAACATMYSGNIDAMTQVMKLLIDRGADVSIQGGKYGTAFQAACWNDDVPTTVIDLLLERGVDVNAQGGRYGNALQAACQRHIRNDASYGEKKHRQECMLEIVQLLLNRDADVHAQGGYYGTALQAACAKQNEDIVRLLINHGADVHAQGGYYGTALQAACVEQNVDIVRLLIDRGADVTVQGGRYGTALQTACVTGNLELVRLLLEKGARVNDEAGYHGTALQAACANSHIEVARLLLEHGADVHLRNNGAWHVAARSRDDDLIRLLLGHGVDVNDTHGSHGSALQAVVNPLQWRPDKESDGEDSDGEDRVGVEWYLQSAHLKWTNRIRLLLENGADPNLAVGPYGAALQIACTVKPLFAYWETNMHPGATAAKFLLEMCPNINVNEQGGLFNSALQAAAYSGQTPTINMLLNRGAHVNARGGKYGSALNAAVIAGFWDIVQVLLDAGATPDCHMFFEPDEEWLQRVLEDDGRGGVERYRKFWEVERADKAAKEASAN